MPKDLCGNITQTLPYTSYVHKVVLLSLGGQLQED